MTEEELRHRETMSALRGISLVLEKILWHLKSESNDENDDEPCLSDWQHGSNIDSMPTQPDIGGNAAAPVALKEQP